MATIAFKDFSGGLQENGAGAPLNQYKVAQNLRVTADNKLETTFGYELDDSVAARHRVAADANGVRRINAMVVSHYGANKTKALFKFVGQKIQYNNGTSLVNLQGPASTDAFATTGVDGDTRYSYFSFLEQYYATHSELNQRPVFWYNSSSTPTLRTAGLPSVNRGAAIGTVTASGGATSGYLWAFCYVYSYTVNGRTFTIRGRPLYYSSSSLDDEGSTSITIPAAFILANGTGEHYDTTNVKIEAYRTQLNGTVYYYYGERANSAGTITAAINTALPIYSTGGVADNWRPPTCKFIHATTQVAYYAHGYDITATQGSSYDNDSTLYTNRLWQSKPGIPSAVPQDFYCEVEEAITGLSSVKSIPIVFTENYVYRVDGVLDSFGRGNMSPKRISETTGCVNHNSIVQTVDGVFFAGNDGFYFTDGFSLKKLSENFSQTYSTIVSTETLRSLFYGAFNPKEKEIVWSCRYDSYEGTNEANCLFTFNLEKGTFTGPHTSGYNNISDQDGTEDVEFSASNFSTTSGDDKVTVPTASLTGVIAKGDVFFCSGFPYGTRVSSDPVINGANTEFYVTTTATATTTYSGKGVDGTKDTWIYFESFQPSALAYMDGYFYHADARGYTFKHKNTLGTRPAIDLLYSDPASWNLLPIGFYYASIDTDFGVGDIRKWVNRATLKSRFSGLIQTNLSVVLKSENDANGIPVETNNIEDTSNTPWGYPGVDWGSSALFSTFSQVIDNEVMMPQEQGLRCTYKSIHIANAVVKIQNSGDMQSEFAVGAVAGLENTVKSLTISAAAWDANVLGYYVKFYQVVNGVQSYLFSGKEFPVVARISDTVIRILDKDNDLSTSTSWNGEVWGYRKGDVCVIQEIDLDFQPLGRGQHPSAPTQSSEA